MQMIAAPIPPKFFFKGLRARPGESVGSDEQGETVGVFLMKQTIGFDGSIFGVNSQPVLMADQKYAPYDASDANSTWFPVLLRLESDLASTKPFLDLVVVNNLAELGVANPYPPDPIELPAAKRFGRVSINSASANVLKYGWFSRGENPRRDLAADPVLNWTPPNIDYVPNGTNLPMGFNNQFHNGGLLAGLAHLSEGDEVVFTQMNSVDDDIAEYAIQIPTEPVLTIRRDGVPVDPHPDIQVIVDTLVLDLKNAFFLVTWRGVFLWRDQFSKAVLEVS